MEVGPEEGVGGYTLGRGSRGLGQSPSYQNWLPAQAVLLETWCQGVDL